MEPGKKNLSRFGCRNPEKFNFENAATGGRTTSAGLGSPRARVHLTKKRAHVHARACNVHVVPINVLRIFSYPKFCCLIFVYNKN